MPFRSETGGFTGNGNMGDFIDQIVETFLTDAVGAGGLGWTSHTNTGSPAHPKGSSPNFEFLFSRGGGSPPTVPIWGMHTNSRSLRIYSGNGIDTNEPAYDQPGNPVNEPNAYPTSDLAGGILSHRCLTVNSAPGSYDGYWVFGGASAEYCHVVLKVNSRQYRHFHVGLLDPLVSDLDPNTFYVTGHSWAYLSPDNHPQRTSETNTDSKEHQPYTVSHLTPFGNNNQNNTAVGWDIRSKSWLYCPNYGTSGYSWWIPYGLTTNADPSGGGSGPTTVAPEVININQPGNARFTAYPTKDIGNVNTNVPPSPLPISPEWEPDIRFGAAALSGYGDAFGATPWACEPTFTTDGVPLIPIYWILPSDFESAIRWGPVGKIPDVFRVNMKSIDAEQEIVIGSDTYVCFPLINKDANNTVAGEGYSGYEGLAYKKITANAT